MLRGRSMDGRQVSNMLGICVGFVAGAAFTPVQAGTRRNKNLRDFKFLARARGTPVPPTVRAAPAKT